MSNRWTSTISSKFRSDQQIASRSTDYGSRRATTNRSRGNLSREKVFSNPWLLEIEKEMAENNMRLERGTDPDMSATLTSLLEIDCEKLRALHEKQGTLRLQIAMEKRKELCVKRGLVDPRYASSVRDVYSPLLVIVEVSNQTCPDQRFQTTMVIRQRHELTTRLRTRTRRCLLHLRARRLSNRRTRTCSSHRRHIVTSPHLMRAYLYATEHLYY